MANWDFVLTARWLTTIGAQYSGHGFIVEQDPTNWIGSIWTTSTTIHRLTYTLLVRLVESTTRCQVLNRGRDRSST